MPAFASNAAPYTVLAHRLWGPVSWLVFFAVCNSAIAVSMACTNAGSRVMYTMAQAGTFPARFGQIHPKYRTPSFAIVVDIAFGIIIVMIVGVIFGGNNIFGFWGTVETLGVIVLYFMANLALVAYMRRERPTEYKPLTHLVFPIIGSLVLLPALFTTVWPVPAYPINLAAYTYVVWMLLGVGCLV